MLQYMIWNIYYAVHSNIANWTILVTYDKVVTVKPSKVKKAVSLSDSDEDNKENDTICISPEKANITKAGFQETFFIRFVFVVETFNPK